MRYLTFWMCPILEQSSGQCMSYVCGVVLMSLKIKTIFPINPAASCHKKDVTTCSLCFAAAQRHTEAPRYYIACIPPLRPRLTICTYFG